MIALWMLYSTLVALIVGVAAATVERAVGATVPGRRWSWMLAVLLAIAIPAWVLAAGRSLERQPDVTSRDLTIHGVSQGAAALSARVADLLSLAPTRPLVRYDTQLIVMWAGIAGLALCLYAVAILSLARRRRGWRPGTVDGQPVLVSNAVGPAVVGALKPAIVVPEWSLGLPDDQRALMIEHERQHVRARDPLVLHSAAIVAMLMPWNVALWWLNRRLRLAVELDCDSRVLARGHDARAYGHLLLNVCSRRQRVGAAVAPALFERTSSLAKRITAMNPRRPRFPRSRLALGVMVAAGVIAVACEMPTPEMLAPDGTNTPTQRLLGKIETVGKVDGPTELKSLVEQRFPSVARGEGGPSILFVVKSAMGEVVLTEAQAAANSRAPQSQTNEIRQSRATGRAEESVPPSKQPVIRLRQTPQGSVATTAAANNLALPVGVGALRPDDIASIDVSKHAAGVIAPNAVSFITIVLKPGARVPQ